MGIFRKNIDRNIQIGLNARIRAMSDYGGTSIVSDQLSSVTDNDLQAADFSLSKESQLAKSPFIRLIAPGTEFTHVLYGMFNVTLQGGTVGEFSEGATDAFTSLQDKVQGAEQSFYNLSDAAKSTSAGYEFGRPQAGIREISVDFVKTGGAVRKAEVQWTVFSLNELEKYHETFLSLGRYVVLDWGWVRSVKGLDNIPALIKEENGIKSIDPGLFEKEQKEIDGKKVSNGPSRWQKLFQEYYGDWSGLVGVISSFDWEQREDGGFDCTTTIMAQGTSIFQQDLPKVKDKATSQEVAMNVKDFDDFMADLTKDLSGSVKDADGTPIQLNIGDVVEAMSGPKLNIVERINSLDVEILDKYFGHIIDEKAKLLREAQQGEQKDQSSGEFPLPGAFVSDDGCIAAIINPTNTTIPGGFIEIFDESSQAYKNEDKAAKRAGDFAATIWVKWGWFEDNVVSYYCRTKTKEGRRDIEFRSIMPYQENGQTQAIPIYNSPELYTHDPSLYILPGQTPTDWFQKDVPLDENGKPTDPIPSLYEQLASKINDQCEAFGNFEDKDKPVGYLRNMFVNLKLIQSNFGSGGQSINSAMLNICKGLNSSIQIWDWETYSQDDLTNNIVTQFIYDKNTPPPVTKPDVQPTPELPQFDNDPKKSYIFENYGFNSIIKDINVKTEISNKMAAMMGISRGGADEKTTDAIKQIITKPPGSKSPEELEAEAYARFFSSLSQKDKDLLKSNVIEEGDEFYGNKSVSAVSPGNLNDAGLDSASRWNHKINPLLVKANPTSRANYAEIAERKMHEQLSKQELEIMTTSGEKVVIEGGTILPKGASDNESILLEYRKPYGLDGKMRSHFVRTLQWYHEDSPMTMVKSSSPDILMPLSVDMTLEGIGGIYPGNVFRLAYLPTRYGQAPGPDMLPKTGFVVMSVNHSITESGWETKIGAQMYMIKSNEPKDGETTDEISKREFYKQNKDIIDKAFKSNFQKMIDLE